MSPNMEKEDELEEVEKEKEREKKHNWPDLIGNYFLFQNFNYSLLSKFFSKKV